MVFVFVLVFVYFLLYVLIRIRGIYFSLAFILGAFMDGAMAPLTRGCFMFFVELRRKFFVWGLWRKFLCNEAGREKW